MSFWSTFYEIEVRDEIAQEFMDETGHVDDMMAGLHEIRARMAEKDALNIQKQPKPVKRQQVKQHSPKRQKKQPDRRVPVA
ncbi:hypothetical protein U14_02094 [Candidatus Moduliflexus flocculans]|uniref:Uncharacterized protein n=1 Tax=Candidatus Moduliflexus flocculans TaxID=1499966 RepID=A0A0S6VTJ9_9BACT|nr:hypothetical protein U14_02094 [Candidatus Moduliflexus flocculans]